MTFGINVLNGQPFLLYNLRALYPFAHQIIVVEGAVVAAQSLATADGHSRDGTLEMIRDFQAHYDPGNKIVLITAEDAGKPNGFWTEKDEMSQAFAQRATGDWLWELGYDEFFLDKDMAVIFEMLKADPTITAVSFPFKQFWGGFDYLETGLWFLYEFRACDRLFRWRTGYRYEKHRPPTVLDENGRDLRSLKWVSDRKMKQQGIYLYHYSYVLPKQAYQKVGYYTHATWTTEFRDNERWLTESYFGLKDPYFIGEGGRRKPQWLERYDGPHPAQIEKMREDLSAGYIEETLRPTQDIENLLNSRLYTLGRRSLRVYSFLLFNTRRVKRGLRWCAANAKRPLRVWVAESPSTRDPRLFLYRIRTEGLRRAILPAYDARFYEEHNALKSGYARLADWIYEWAKPASVCDVGCGNAFLLYFFAQKGVQVSGVEGSSVALEYVDPSIRDHILVADATASQDLGAYDLVISTEVAEHIPKRASSMFISNLARSAMRHILFTAASPGQWGDGHINCQPQEFWIELFAEQGWTYDNQATEAFIGKVKSDPEIVKTLPWMVNNFMLFVPKGASFDRYSESR
ncbi:MAG: methyltransferase domain-containing protein [Gaiellaceae bacterium]